jgi:hypothetical protein
MADNTNQKEEQTMTIHEYLMKAIQDDARRAGERDRLLREARRARRARRQRITVRRELADQGRLVGGARPPRRRRWRLGRGWWQWARWSGGTADRPVGRSHRAS